MHTYESGIADGGFQQQSTAQGLKEKGVRQVKSLAGTARERLLQAADARKDQWLGQLDGWIETIDDIAKRLGEQGGPAAEWSGKISSQIRGVTDGLKAKSADELLHSAEQQIRARPGAFVAGCAVLGFLGVRLIRS